MKTFRIICTSDVHGAFFPYDFINHKEVKGSLAQVSSYVNQMRKDYGNHLILLDNGDILQGQPSCYYCNFVKPNLPNVAASIVNYMKYDTETIGNHDIETGHKVYDKWIKEVNCPVLGANIIDNETGQPYLKPYSILERDGKRFAILGMLTPAIPNWLNEKLFHQLHFESIVTSTRYWMKEIKTLHPDYIIGLFHSGFEGGIHTDEYDENEAIRVAQEIPGFDVIFCGHDHRLHIQTVKDCEGKTVTLVNPSSNAHYVAEAEIGKDIKVSLTKIEDEPVDQKFLQTFMPSIKAVKEYVDRKIAIFTTPIRTRDSFFGNSAFNDFIHDLQLKITQADISFNAPLSFDTSIEEGNVLISDMFNLYTYENQLYVLELTGKEIKNFLEMSYDQWIVTMHKAEDHIMLMDEKKTESGKIYYHFRNLAFNFDSACGIDYDVDVTKEKGRRIYIHQMTNGEPFDEGKRYRVAMNSYRGNGGGELLTKGAGIPRERLKERIVYISEEDQRFLFTREIEEMGYVSPQKHDNWHFIPKEWTADAIERDRKLLFPCPI